MQQPSSAPPTEAHPSPPRAQKNRGLLHGIRPEQVAASAVNIYDPNLTVEALFGDDTPSGGALLDLVLAYYSDGQRDVPFFVDAPVSVSSDGQMTSSKSIRAIEKSSLSREIQEATVESYKNRIFLESISQVAAGQG